MTFLPMGIAAFGVAVILLGGGVPLLPAVLVPVGLATGLWYFCERPDEPRQERWAKGQCPRCGYDLSGNVSGVCPECGKTC